MNTRIAVDVGNSFIKSALFEDDQLVDFWRQETTNAEGAAEAIVKRPAVAVAVSSVVPTATEQIVRILTQAGREISFVKPNTQKILSNMNPEMGGDRVADAVAGWCIYGERKKATIVMGFGTATTILAITDNGRVAGGLIAPGLNLMFQVLHEKCALLPLLSSEGAQAILGNDTDSHIKNGVLLAHMGLIRQWLDSAKQDLEGEIITVATGNLAKSLEVHENLFDAVDPMLTLKGINLIAQECA